MAPTSQGSPISQRSRSKPPPPRSLAATALTSACWSVDRTRTDAPLGWGAAFCALRSRRFLAVSVRNPSIIGQFCAEKRRVRREHSTVSSSRAQGWAPAGRRLGAGWAPAAHPPLPDPGVGLGCDSQVWVRWMVSPNGKRRVLSQRTRSGRTPDEGKQAASTRLRCRRAHFQGLQPEGGRAGRTGIDGQYYSRDPT